MTATTTNAADNANIAARLVETAESMPNGLALVVPKRRDRQGKRQYARYTFRELNDDSDRLARGLRRLGAVPGMRLALMVRPSFDFISLVFALFKSGAVQILIDPGMGRHNVVQCLEEAEPEGFVALPVVQAARLLMRRRFPRAKLNVTVGRRWFWGGPTISDLRRQASDGPAIADVRPGDPAAIIFTSGSTGVPKGVLYRHGNFNGQVDQIRDFYNIAPGEVDLSCFPLFALFNAAMGVTTVLPEMDFSRPAEVDPRNILEAAEDCQVTQAFGSPAVWNRVGRYCQEQQVRLPSLRRVLSAGAPVPGHVLARMKDCIHAQGEVHTPYGATESLPVASISASEVLSETQALTDRGAGVCVGRKFSGIEWKVVRIVDGPIATLDEAVELPAGEIGELIVSGPVVTREYVNRRQSNALAKIADGPAVWHRMGDVGYVDQQQRFWFCGRMSQRVVTAEGTLFTIPCEAIFNTHPQIFRSALVGVPLTEGEAPAAAKRPVMIVEPWPEHLPRDAASRQKLIAELRELGLGNPRTASIRTVLIHSAFPVDIRHNAKIFREQLAVWAAEQLRPLG